MWQSPSVLTFLGKARRQNGSWRRFCFTLRVCRTGTCRSCGVRSGHPSNEDNSHERDTMRLTIPPQVRRWLSKEPRSSCRTRFRSRLRPLAIEPQGSRILLRTFVLVVLAVGTVSPSRAGVLTGVYTLSGGTASLSDQTFKYRTVERVRHIKRSAGC